MNAPATSRSSGALAPILALTLLAAGCLGTSSGVPDPIETAAVALRGSRVDLVQSPVLDEIGVLEDTRTLGGGRLLELANDERALVRQHAVRALGRMPFPELGAPVTAALCAALEDGDPEVRLEAAFALGVRGDAEGGPPLFGHLQDPDPRLRALVVEALSKLDRPDLHAALLGVMGDPDLGVQVEAVLATARWSPKAANASAVDRALLDVMTPFDESGRGRRTQSVSPELGWRVLFALDRRESRAARASFLSGMRSSRPLERLFAARGLRHQEADPEIVRALVEGLYAELPSGDWRVAVEAIGSLEVVGGSLGHVALVEALGTSSFHVRAAAARALSAFPKQREAGMSAVARALRDVSPTVRGEALVSFAKLAPQGEAWNAIEKASTSQDPLVRLGAVRAAGALKDERSLAYLLERLLDSDELVAGAAVPLLGERGDLVRDRLHRLLSSEDNGLRLAAVLALEERPAPGDIDPLIRAFESTQGDISTEVAFHVLRALGKQPGPKSKGLLQRAARDGRPFVRRTAREVLAEAFATQVEPTGVARPSVRENLRLPDYRFNPIVEVRTTKGTMVFELFPAEAPMHVHNFLLLTNRRHFDGLRFHRVVSDFVIQGGDYRGDGNGAAPAFGVELAHEFGRRRYVRGSLGMPRYDDVDSGGSQFFVTHRPTPHLDGRYTIFGELRAGGDVLDAIEIGDRILAVDLVRADS